MNKKGRIVAVDFDGTIVSHRYPQLGKPVPNALKVLRRLTVSGNDLILSTMRSGRELLAAVDYLTSQGIKLFGVNENPEKKSWTLSSKIYAHLYIGDDALGCPLVRVEEPRHWDAGDGARPYVDWFEVERQLVKLGYLN